MVARGPLSGRWISLPEGAVPRYAPRVARTRVPRTSLSAVSEPPEEFSWVILSYKKHGAKNSGGFFYRGLLTGDFFVDMPIGYPQVLHLTSVGTNRCVHPRVRQF